MSRKASWDAELYEAQHSFVWQFGQDLIEVLRPQAGERILDLGCGTGQLTRKIADSGAQVVGLDSSPEMIGQARQNYPDLTFTLQDAASMRFDHPFDAVFSNAALHWMLDREAVARAVASSLRPGGRFVAELGGRGNIAAIENAVRAVLPAYLSGTLPASRTFFPSLAEYAGLLEQQGLEVRSAMLFDRPTPLEGSKGMDNWLRQFMSYYLESLAPRQQDHAIAEIVEVLRPVLWSEGGWIADYRRLRIMVIKL
jgi:trans-aconitate methyltransferase